MKERLKLHNLHIDHVTIRSELKYLIGAKAVGTVKLELQSGSNLAKNPRFYGRTGEQPVKTKRVGFWPCLEPNRTEPPVKTRTAGGLPRPVANTTCEYRLINRCIAGAMKLLTRYINFSCVRANSARMLLRSALPQGQVSICEKDYEEVQIMMKAIIDGSRC